MKNLEIYENFQPQGRKNFTDEEIKYYSKLWSFLNIRHANNPFFSKLYNQMTTKKSLTQNQWSELEYLLKNGRSKYEAGILPRNN